MMIKLFIIALLCASALADGAWVLAGLPNQPQPLEFFTDLHQNYPDFVIIYYQERLSFNQAYQNAVTAGYKSIHLSVLSEEPLSPEVLPADFKGRVWLSAETLSYPNMVSQVENLANQGFNVGIMDYCLAGHMTGVVPSVVSSLPFAWIYDEKKPWAPFAGWDCPAITVKYVGWDPKKISAIFSCTVNVSCI